MHTITEEGFLSLLGSKIRAPQRERALKMFREYGPNLEVRTTGVLHQASEKHTFPYALACLERHYDEYLRHQPEGARGLMLEPGEKINRTKVMLDELQRELNSLGPSPQSEPKKEGEAESV